jgi:hypothetical protein
VSGPVLERVSRLRERYGIADRRVEPIVPPPEPAQLPLFALPGRVASRRF